MTIQYYTKHGGSDILRDDDLLIHAPLIYTGRDKYGALDLKLRLVLDMTMQFTFISLSKFSISLLATALQAHY